MDPTRPNPYGYAPRGGYRPFRPNHYNRPPPGMPYGNIPPQQPPPHFPNLKLGGYAQPPLRPPPPMMAPPPTFEMNLNNSKLNTLFVGAIAAGVQDEWIEQLLKACGSLIEWKRVKDQAGNPKGFGFATYQDPDSVLRALRILGGEENNKGIVLKAQDGSQIEKTLIVKADDNVRNYLNHYKSSRAAVTDEKEKDEKSLEKVNTIVQHIHSGKKVEDVKEMDITSQPSSTLIDTTVNNEDNKEQNEKKNIMDTLGKDLAFLREQATKTSPSQDQQNNTHERHRSISEEEENSDHHHQRHRHHRHHHDEDRRQQQRKRQEFVKGHTEQLSIEDYDPELEKDDEEAERRKQEKYQKEMEITFRQREKRFEQRELTRLEEHEHNLKKNREDQERRLNEKEFWAKRLAEWDDDIEMKNDDNEFYNDRSRWRKARLHLKRREEERDEEDRRLAMDIDKAHEKENISNSQDQSPSVEYQNKKQNSNELSNTRSPSSLTATPSLPASPIKVAPTKLKTTKINLGQLPTKRMGGNLGDDDDDEDNGRKRRVLIPLDYSEIKDEDTLMEDNQNQTTTTDQDQQQQEENETQDIPILSEEERNQKIKELISSIPSSEDQLWKWDIRWDVLNEDVMNTKLQPFVAKKILELVGTEEDELITFILDSVRKHTAPVDLVAELEMTLDEDALVFVMKLWRTIIFETERLARHL